MLVVPDVPGGPSPAVPILLVAFMVLYVLLRGGAIRWVRTNLLRLPEADEDRPGEKD
ncbi:hypothetical protein [Halorientalis sp. IM1011]|uniref:hypothetical protein n=1 Tax=Halorientalis sp. IM1011 TaxID=1932360 RepID=UPI0012FC8675|nr:hypothetical protein [Halorientalis sp. IM1011]